MACLILDMYNLIYQEFQCSVSLFHGKWECPISPRFSFNFYSNSSLLWDERKNAIFDKLMPFKSHSSVYNHSQKYVLNRYCTNNGFSTWYPVKWLS